MPIQFSQLYIADGAIVGFHDLTPGQQKMVIEIRTSTVELVDLLCCPVHPEEKTVIHTSFRDTNIHNTLVVCCPGFRASVEAALNGSPFDCSCICLVRESDGKPGL